MGEEGEGGGLKGSRKKGSEREEEEGGSKGDGGRWNRRVEVGGGPKRGRREVGVAAAAFFRAV